LPCKGMQLLLKRLACTFLLLALIIDQSEQKDKVKRKKNQIKSKDVLLEGNIKSKNTAIEGMGKQQQVPANVSKHEQKAKEKRKKSHNKRDPRERNIKRKNSTLEGNIKNKNVPLERNTTSKNATLEGMGKQQLVPANVSKNEQRAKLERKQIHLKSKSAPRERMDPQQLLPDKVKEVETDKLRSSRPATLPVHEWQPKDLALEPLAAAGLTNQLPQITFRPPAGVQNTAPGLGPNVESPIQMPSLPYQQLPLPPNMLDPRLQTQNFQLPNWPNLRIPPNLQHPNGGYPIQTFRKHNSTFLDVSEPRGQCGLSGMRPESEQMRPESEPEALKPEISGGREASHSYPWIVRLLGGCAQGLCAGSLITARHVLTAFHCTIRPGSWHQSCDHTDGRRIAVLGRHSFDINQLENYYTIPIIDVRSPPRAGLTDEDLGSHDIALYLLAEPALFSERVRPICIPVQGYEHYGEMATVIGWGRFSTPDRSNQGSPYLRQVKLRVSKKRYMHYHMFATELWTIKGAFQDACAGDSGGPLMFKDKIHGRWVIIGVVTGLGFDCRTGRVTSFEGEKDGIYGMVASHTNWILNQLKTTWIPTPYWKPSRQPRPAPF